MFDRQLSLDLDWVTWRLECTQLSDEEREQMIAIKALLETHIPASTAEEREQIETHIPASTAL